MKKSALIGIFFIVIMLGSTIAYSVISAVRFPQTTDKTNGIPTDTNVINYELTSQQQDILIQNGEVIAKYTYKINCLECTQQKSYLESFAGKHSDQVFLEIISGNVTAQNSTLDVNSLRGSNTLTNVTQENILSVFCELMLSPPVDCALRKV